MIPAGLLLIDKPSGITSHGVVSVVRRTLHTRKVGHAGTLDPMATGVLVLGVERATRVLGYLALSDKEYLATIRLGAATVTDDFEGDVLSTAEPVVLRSISDEAIAAEVSVLTGEIDQVPSAVSAIKVDGKRAHALVRAGEDVVLKSRRVTVQGFDVQAIRRGLDFIDLDVVVNCSTGTYVRALARDLGAVLGVGGHLTALRRSRVGSWSQDEVVSLQAFTDSADPAAHLMGLDAVAARAFRTREVTNAEAEFIRTGRIIPWAEPTGAVSLPAEPVALVTDQGRLLALAQRRGGDAKYLAVFAE
ncbi:MAG: tRNA pseudouridine(55) synthase TruB [Candidatus Nanopelagicales bacterium]